MKKLILSLFVLGSLTFGLQSCGEEECTSSSCPSGQECVNGECEDIQATTCDACGTYDGEADGDVEIILTGTDTLFTDLPVSATITQNSVADSYNMAVDISVLLGSPAGTLVPDVDGTLSGSVITITNQVYNYQGIASITINGDVTFDSTFDNLVGELTLTGAADGTLEFSGVKQ